MNSDEKWQFELQQIRQKHLSPNDYTQFIHHYQHDLNVLYQMVINYYDISYDAFVKIAYDTSIE
jgi:hypothetical protein